MVFQRFEGDGVFLQHFYVEVFVNQLFGRFAVAYAALSCFAEWGAGLTLLQVTLVMGARHVQFIGSLVEVAQVVMDFRLGSPYCSQLHALEGFIGALFQLNEGKRIVVIELRIPVIAFEQVAIHPCRLGVFAGFV